MATAERATVPVSSADYVVHVVDGRDLVGYDLDRQKNVERFAEVEPAEALGKSDCGQGDVGIETRRDRETKEQSRYPRRLPARTDACSISFTLEDFL
jgi:hypothetical protein